MLHILLLSAENLILNILLSIRKSDHFQSSFGLLFEHAKEWVVMQVKVNLHQMKGF